MLALALPGCTEPAPPAPTTVPPPEDAGGFGSCHSTSAQQMTVPVDANPVDSSGGRGVGLHRLNATSFLWVWAEYVDTLRQDKITRLNEVGAYREPDAAAPLELCTRVEIAAPTQVDGARRSYAVAARFDATAGLPPGPVRVLVDWVAGCPCAPLPSGNATRTFD